MSPRLNTRAAMLGTTAVAGASIGGYLGLVTGRLSLDLGLGRRTRPLGPLDVDITAPPERVFAAAAAPYAERRPRAMREKVDILHRSADMVLAAHKTPLGNGLTAVTVETVVLEPPHRITFRLVRGPVPYVAETFDFQPTETGTRLVYTGEMGTDLGRVGAVWGDAVARSWVHAVERSLAVIKSAAEH